MIVRTLLLLLSLALAAGCGAGGRSDHAGDGTGGRTAPGTADPTVNRPGPVARPGSWSDETSDAPYAPGDRVDLGSADGILAGAPGTTAGITVALPGDMDGDGYAEIVAANSLDLSSDATHTRGSVAIVYGGPEIDEDLVPDATLLPPFGSGGGGEQPWVAPAGDVNGDGLADLLVGIPGHGREVGAAYLVYGSPARLAGRRELAREAVRLTDGVVGGRFGARVAGLGDVNGDGYGDFGVVAFDLAEGAGISKAFFYYGARTRLSDGARPDARLVGSADETAGVWIAPAGNIDMDQYDDFLLVVYRSDDFASSYVDLVRGSPIRMNGTVAVGDIAARFDGPADDVAGLGDLDGDGPDDFAVSSHDEPLVHTFYGDLLRYREPFGAEDAQMELTTADPVATLRLARAGDTNGDGNRDFLVGIAQEDEMRGAVHLVLGTGERFEGDIDLDTESVTFLGREDDVAGDVAGASIAGGEDVDGDGLDDILIGAPTHSHGDPNGGHVYLVLGIAR